MHNFNDSVTLKGTRITDDGYMVTEAFAVRTGIQLYTGKEVDPDNTLGLRDKDIVRVYRSEQEVRSPNSLSSFSHAPVTMGHPKEAVTADNWKDLAVGEVSTEAVWDGNKIKLPLIIKDSLAIQGVQSGERELSAGYTCQLVADSGVSPEGEEYDAEQKDIRINHLAVVKYGRAGSECRIGDADNWGPSPITKEVEMTMKHIAIGDATAAVAETDADKVTAFIGNLRDAHSAAIDAKDAEIAKKDAKIAELEAKQMSESDIDKRVAERAQLVSDASTIAPKADFSGLTDAEIRKKAVVTIDAKYADKSDAYISAMFDIQLDAAKVAKEQESNSDPVLKHVIDNQSNRTKTDDSLGYGARENDLMNNWKQKD